MLALSQFVRLFFSSLLFGEQNHFFWELFDALPLPIWWKLSSCHSQGGLVNLLLS